jgi:tetratricopeptide (TPR) repeat protein
MSKWWSLIARLMVAVTLAGVTAVTATRLRRVDERPYDVAIIPTAPVLRWASLGHPTLAANIQWLRAVQYIGEPKANERGWERLYPLLELVTELDPGHGYAYQVGGVILSSVGRIAESNALLEKGIENVPDRYILPFLRAFNAFYYDDDFAAAGHFVELAAKAPNAPAHLRNNVLAYYVKGRRADAAIQFLEQSRAESQDADTAKAIDEQLKQAYLERDAAELEQAAKEYNALFGRPPLLLEQLVSAQLIARIPPDPFGGVYFLGSDGRVRSSVHDFRFKRPGELGKRAEPGVTPETGYPGSTISR